MRHYFVTDWRRSCSDAIRMLSLICHGRLQGIYHFTFPLTVITCNYTQIPIHSLAIKIFDRASVINIYFRYNLNILKYRLTVYFSNMLYLLRTETTLGCLGYFRLKLLLMKLVSGFLIIIWNALFYSRSSVYHLIV